MERGRRLGGRRERLLRRMPIGGVCAEIGVWRGDFSAKIIDVTKPRRLHLIDPWKHESDEAYQAALYGGRAAAQAEMDAIYRGVADRFATEVQTDLVTIHRAPSTEAVAAFADGSLDWVYIDGNHLYEFVKADLESWSPKVKRGGYVTGDDYGEGNWWKGGVKQAVDEFAARMGGELVIIGRQFLLQLS